MNKAAPFDIQEAHRHFSTDCFNKAWDLIDNPNRTDEDNAEMLQTCLVSLWHWKQRADVTPHNLSIGYWQVSRVYALLGKAAEARQYGQWSLRESEGLEPFFVGYAFEALARSEKVAGNVAGMSEYLALARKLCEEIPDPDNKKLLLADLDSIA